MANHNFNFDGGEYLAKIGAAWFVSYIFYEIEDKTHLNWKNVLTTKYRISIFNKTRKYHNYWLQQVLNMNDEKIKYNTIKLEPVEIKTMAKILLKEDFCQNNLIIGKQYKKSDFGIIGSERQWSEITVEGKLFTFFSVVSKYENIIEKDGFVYEGRGRYALIPNGVTANLNRYVFYRESPDDDWTYLGKGKYEKRYDDKRNKIFW